MNSSASIIRIEDSRPAARRRTVSLVVPVFNEQDSIIRFIDRVDLALRGAVPEVAFEILFVDDGSRDDTRQVIEQAAATRTDIALVMLSRNFGKEAALLAGLRHAKGDAVIPLDVDLQDPPEVIPQMIARWMAGARVVNARRATRASDSWMKRTTATAFYRVFNMMADYPIPRGVGDFRLLDREVVETVCQLGERSRFNKALFSWVGFETEEICYDRPAREMGESRWSYWKLLKLALDGIFASSTAPLRIWTWVGLAMAMISLGYSSYIFARTAIFGVDLPGYASTVILILTFGGMNMFALGIIGEYIGRIYTEVRQRPHYIVRSYRPAGEVSDGSRCL